MSPITLIEYTLNHPEIAALVALLAYLLGSIPFGLLFTKMAGLGDIRAIGSGNIGATNVLRTGNKYLAALTLICDALKGFVAMWVCSLYAPPLFALAGPMAFLGHLFPVWLKFKGGKGVATYIGVAFGFSATLGIVFCSLWLVVAILFRYSSLAAIVALIITPYFAFFNGATDATIILGLISMLSVLRHRANIKRLLHGQESRIKFRK